ncbi:MAG: hypothetical protein RRC34_02830 [Lentisphaeria bacterium]|nr:hypothetical protein [Lentisphaeria bacterium]
MDKPAIRLVILQAIAKQSPAPCDAGRVKTAVFLDLGEDVELKEIKAMCLELASAGYLVNLKHSLDPVFKGVTATAVAQLEMSVKLDPMIWGDIAL